jgi:hypothetical protein
LLLQKAATNREKMAMSNRIVWILFMLTLTLWTSSASFSEGGIAKQAVQSAPTTLSINGGSSPTPELLAGSISVDAQTVPTVVMRGTYTGFCTVPWVGSQPTAIVFYGAGHFMDPNANNPSDCTNNGNFGGGSPPVTPGQGAAETAAAQGQSAPLIGNGKLKGLVITDSIKSTSTGPSSGLAEVWVTRGSETIHTGIECTLGTSNRCEDATHAFTVIDGDGLIVTLTDQPSDTLQNVQFFLGKL